MQVPAASLDEVHRNPPPLKLWQKVAPLAIIFFGASFNLTILQVGRHVPIIIIWGAVVMYSVTARGQSPMRKCRLPAGFRTGAAAWYG